MKTEVGIHRLGWEFVDVELKKHIDDLTTHGGNYAALLAVSRGGIIPGYRIYLELKKRKKFHNLAFGVISVDCKNTLKQYSGQEVIVFDDIIDTGSTMTAIVQQALACGVEIDFCVLVNKAKFCPKEDWVVFPWETEEDTPGGVQQAATAILRGVGEDPLREGLVGTPLRVERMWKELTAGYAMDPVKILSTTFSKESYDEMVVVKDIKYFSTCEHHLLPFFGSAHFAYIPDKHVVGLSKIPRLVEMFARRLQIQERMTMQIGKTFEEIVKPLGVAVVVEGVHLCMMVRGVKQQNSQMKTSYLSGHFREEPAARQEFLSMIK